MDKPLNFAIFLLLVSLCLAWYGSKFWICRRLKNQHPEKYADMGKPSLFFRSSIANSWRFLRFLWKGEYNSLNDPLLRRLCNVTKILLGTYFLLLLSVLLFFSSFTKAK